jgi:hypothetical protein
MVKKNIVLACLYVIETNDDLKKELVSLLPELHDLVSKIENEGCRFPNGTVNNNYRDAANILDSNDKVLSEWGEKHREKMARFAALQYENINKHRENFKTLKSLPAFKTQLKSVASSVLNFAKSGLDITDPAVLEKRLAICKSCEFWDAKAFNETGRCNKCGCSTWAKLRMATEKCPIDKWGPVTHSSPEQTQQPNTN